MNKNINPNPNPNPNANISICNSIKTLIINKIIIRNLNPNELENKFIFIGHRENNIITILNKLAQKKTLNKTDTEQLELVIPKYTIKFGNIQDYNIYFIYHYLEEQISINHTLCIIYETIKHKLGVALGNKIYNYLPHNLLIYKYSSVIDYKNYINLLNYIFEKSSRLNNEHFFNKLYKFTFYTKQQIQQKIIELLPLKYKNSKHSKQKQSSPNAKADNNITI